MARSVAYKAHDGHFRRHSPHRDLDGRDMVAAANPLAAQAGRENLAAGGSAIDTAE
jgi:gamma-glutamyltranspeptidase